jgi:hypothetical protein
MNLISLLRARLLCLAILGYHGWTPSAYAEYGPVGKIATELFEVQQDGETLYAPYLLSKSLKQTDPTITRLVCVQHGAARDPYSYLSRMVGSAKLAGVEEQTLVASFQWLEEKDIEAHRLDTSLPVNQLLFYSSGWRGGDASLSTSRHPRPFRVSNFEVIDQFLLHAAERLPNLKQVVVTGHSAGGQVVNRYAISNVVEPTLKSTYGISVQYIVFNPSSYLYLDDRRWDAKTEAFNVPTHDSLKAAPRYNQFKYGLNGVNQYFQRTPNEKILEDFPNRSVIYAIGELDNDPAHQDLDTDPSAMLQGDTRLTRGVRYFKHLNDLFGDKILSTQRVVILPGVAHSSAGCFMGAAGCNMLFGTGERDDGPIDKYGLRNLD